jgi:starch synthase
MRQNFSWDKSAKQYIRTYREVLGLPPEEETVQAQEADSTLTGVIG